jgi:uncharacterized protein YecA (UPF0149 family)
MFEKVASPARLAANRANGLKSTGPTSEEGKSKSRRNASRHHLTGQVMTMTDEDRSAYERFLKTFKADFNLNTALEATLCEQVAHGFWRLSRANALEENYFAIQADWKESDIKVEHPEISNAFLQALNFFAQPEKFSLLTLYEQRIHRKTHKDLKTLMDLQAKHELAKPLTAAAEPVAEAATAAGSAASVENGFVCSNAFQGPQVSHVQAKHKAAESEATAESTASAENGFVYSNDTKTPQVGRNSKCPCGSGLKFKRCCLGQRAVQHA